MKRLFVVLAIIQMIIVFLIPAGAITPYSNLNESASQVTILCNLIISDDDYNIFLPYCIVRSGEYEYLGLFNIEDTHALAYRYYTQSGYNNQWHYEYLGDYNNFTINHNGYLYVSNLSGGQSSSIMRDHLIHVTLKYSIPCLVLAILLYVFRVHKRDGRL